MNFEFLKNIKSLKHIYKYCNNAEELALTKPDCSMFSARKSGEALARYIYLNAYKYAAENLTFADILTDYTVKRYIDSREVLDALHSIRKNGNAAVHGENDNTPDQALNLLEKLHFAVGEIARKGKLIASYPQFDMNIERKDGVELFDFDPVMLAEEMFNENINRYKAEKLFEAYKSFCSSFRFVPGDSDIIEFLEVKSKPSKTAIHYLQSYFGSFAMKAIEQYYEDNNDFEIHYEASLKIFGNNQREITNLFDFMEWLMNELPEAENFSIYTKYHGPQYAGKIDDDFDVPLHRHMSIEKCDNATDITYKVYEFLYNQGEGWCGKFENGSWVNLKSKYSQKVLDVEYPKEWFCWCANLAIEFDFEKYPSILRELRKCVRKHVPEDQYEYCESAWEDDPHILINDISWSTKRLSIVQDFLIEVNAIIEPIKDECDCYADGYWYYFESSFAVAAWEWIEDEFKILGTSY